MGNLTSVALRGAARVLSPAGERARLSVLIYHRVLPVADPLRPSEVDAGRFEWQLSTLKRHFNVLPLTEAIERLTSATLPERSACITFDDGYADNEVIALPILVRHQLPATFFVATGYLDGGCMWNDAIIEAIRATRKDHVGVDGDSGSSWPVRTVAERRRAISEAIKRFKHLEFGDRSAAVDHFLDQFDSDPPRDLMMTPAQVRALAAAGMEIGGHTVMHPILSSTSLGEAENEIRAGKAHLENMIDADVRSFAYPNGRRGRDYGPEHVALVRKLGFEGAVSTDAGVARFADSGYELPRFTPWDKSPTRFAARLVRNIASAAVADSSAPASDNARMSA